MRRSARLLAAFAALAFALAPAIADARPGGSTSSGSRGARTYSAPPSTNTYNGQVRPMERTMTSPGATAPAAAAAAPQRSGLFGGGLMGGLMGGLIGAGLFGLLFGHGMFGGLSGMMGFLGFLLQIALLVLVVRFAIGFFRRNANGAQPAPGLRPAMAGGPAPMAREAQPGPMGGHGGGGAASAPAPVIGEADFQAFERTLITINGAWSAKDLDTLARLSTPEMLAYFRQDLSDLAARNWHNETRDVTLEQGDLAEAWSEGRLEYATVAMRFSLIDVTKDLRTGAVVEGNPHQRQMVTEIWTFVRPIGGAWQLSAIQQPG